MVNFEKRRRTEGGVCDVAVAAAAAAAAAVYRFLVMALLLCFTFRIGCVCYCFCFLGVFVFVGGASGVGWLSACLTLLRLCYLNRFDLSTLGLTCLFFGRVCFGVHGSVT